jgi:hypothetical protein
MLTEWKDGRWGGKGAFSIRLIGFKRSLTENIKDSIKPDKIYILWYNYYITPYIKWNQLFFIVCNEIFQ